MRSAPRRLGTGAHFPKIAIGLLGPPNGDIDGADAIRAFFNQFP